METRGDAVTGELDLVRVTYQPPCSLRVCVSKQSTENTTAAAAKYIMIVFLITGLFYHP